MQEDPDVVLIQEVRVDRSFLLREPRSHPGVPIGKDSGAQIEHLLAQLHELRQQNKTIHEYQFVYQPAMLLHDL